MARPISTTNSFQLLWVHIKGQLRAPLGHFTFWAYLFVVILGLGALGIYVELNKLRSVTTLDGVLTAIYTYFPAVAAGAGLQMGLDAGRKKYVLSFAVTIMFVLLLLAVLHALRVYSTPGTSLAFGVLGIAGSTVFWWIANSGNETFLDFDPVNSLGGTAESDPQGDSAGFNI